MPFPSPSPSLSPSPSHATLTRSSSYLPVTALALHRLPSGTLLALAGIDAAVLIYNADADADALPPRLLCSIPVFTDQPVHGLCVQADPAHSGSGAATVLVWGAREVALFTITETLLESSSELPAVTRATAPDWICDAALHPTEPGRAVLVTAHNEVIPLRWSQRELESSNHPDINLGEATSPSRAMLFAARAVWENLDAPTEPDSVLIAGGTVFGHILVWRYCADQLTATPQLLFHLRGFEGSIFGVDISPPLDLGNGNGNGNGNENGNGGPVRLLAACSDDRTVRVWDVSGPAPAPAPAPAQESRFAGDLDTGFGGDFEDEDEDDGRSPPPLGVVGMAHASRVWGVRFAALGGRPGVRIYSFGEDAVARRWVLDLDLDLDLHHRGESVEEAERLRLTGRILPEKAYSLHHGKHLWSHAVLAEKDPDLYGVTTIATGGADGQINIIAEPADNLNSAAFSKLLDVREILQTIDPSTSTLPIAKEKEIVGRYDFVTQDQILVTTNQGRLLLGTLDEGCRDEWQEIPVDAEMEDDLRSCYVVKTVAHGGALLGTTGGKVLFFRLATGAVGSVGSVGSVSRVAALPGKIVDIKVLSWGDGIVDGIVDVLVFLHGQVDSYVLGVEVEMEVEVEVGVAGGLRRREQIRGLDPRFVATSAAAVDDMIVLGSRHGWLSILKRKRDEGDAKDRKDGTDGTFRPILNLATRSFDSITAIVPLPLPLPLSTTSPGGMTKYILVTSKDGKYRIYELERTGEGLHLRLCHETCPPFGPVITDAWFTASPAPELILCGFRSKAFVIWNESRKEEVANIDCGGAHRTFQLVHDAGDASRYRFAYTKTSKLALDSSRGPTHRSLRTGIHGREIKALSWSGRYIASGAEDTSIRIWEHQSKGTELRCVATIKAHVTGIQRLAWFEDSYLFSSAGNEEFFVWRVRALDSAYESLAVFREAELSDKSPEGDLRITDFDVGRRHAGEGIIITMAFSNSTLRTFRYVEGEAGGRFESVAEGKYTGACLTQIRHLGLHDGCGLSVLAAATDGHLMIWHARERGPYVLEEAAQLHQNSIKSLALLALDGSRSTTDGSGSRYLVFTGGDDNALGMAVVRGGRFHGRGIARRAHAAAVTGVALALSRPGRDLDGRCGIYGISSGNDQRVKVWRIDLQKADGKMGRNMMMRLVGEEGTGVADVGDVAVMGMSAGRVVLGGVGMEIWDVDVSFEIPQAIS